MTTKILKDKNKHMNDQKLQLIDKIKSAKNVLVTVSANPSVDQLAAAIGLTLILNKLDKHATAVYSGDTPSTIEFLKPEETLEKNTDSLRDFIISLDKAKADKLRYKVEEKVVKIFITPYRTSLTADDLEFSQGDFNVDVVIALGVHFQQDLDAAITAHGRILHDAVVTTINNTPDGDLGSINWQDPAASSLSEQVASLTNDLGADLLDNQIATALLTGVVAETGRFRNTKTSPTTMSLSAGLMAAGANQQLVASELEQITEPMPIQSAGVEQNSPVAAAMQEPEESEEPKPSDGTLEIEHDHDRNDQPKPPEPAEVPEPPTALQEVLPELPPVDDDLPKIADVKAGGDSSTDGDGSTEEPEEIHEPDVPKFVTEPPTMGGVLTANSRPEALDPATDPLSAKPFDAPLLDRSANPQYSDGSPSPSPDLAALNDDFQAQPAQPVEPIQLTPPAPDPVPAPPTQPEPSLATLLDSSAASSATAPPATQYDNETLEEIEAQVHHDEPAPAEPAESAEEAPTDVNSARQAVEDAIKASPNAGDAGPIQALNAQPFGDDLRPPAQPEAPAPPAPDQQFTMPVPPSITLPPADVLSPTASPNADPSAPPPVPPPMMPPGFVNPNQQ